MIDRRKLLLAGACAVIAPSTTLAEQQFIPFKFAMAEPMLLHFSGAVADFGRILDVPATWLEQ